MLHTKMSTSTTNHQTTQPDIHTLPSRLPSQHSKHSCQNSGTSNTTIFRWLGRAGERQSEKKTCNGCWTDTSGQLTFSTSGLCRLNPHSLHCFFFSSPFHSFLSLILFTSLSHDLSFLPSIYLYLSFAPGTVPLLSHISSHNSSGKTSLNLTPRMWVHMSKSSNNTEILQIRSCQIKGGISGAHPSLRKGQLKACSRPDLHVKTHSMIQTTS